jgi:hypothetical protein
MKTKQPKSKTGKILERDVKKLVKQWLNLHGILFHDVPNQGTYNAKRDRYMSFKGTAGAPDLVACVKGLYVGIELKAPGRTQSLYQKDFQQRIEKAGGIYLIARGVEDLEWLLHFNHQAGGGK